MRRRQFGQKAILQLRGEVNLVLPSVGVDADGADVRCWLGGAGDLDVAARWRGRDGPVVRLVFDVEDGKLRGGLDRGGPPVGVGVPACAHQRGQAFGHCFGVDGPEAASDLVEEQEGALVFGVGPSRSGEHLIHDDGEAVNVARIIVFR